MVFPKKKGGGWVEGAPGCEVEGRSSSTYHGNASPKSDQDQANTELALVR